MGFDVESYPGGVYDSVVGVGFSIPSIQNSAVLES